MADVGLLFALKSGMRNLITAALLLTVLASQNVQAGSTSAQMNVSATVVARAIIASDDHPLEIVIGRDDIARGYVDVLASMRVKTNDRLGYVMVFTPTNGAFDRMTVRMDDATIEIASTEVFIGQPFRGIAAQDVRLSYRLHLPRDFVAGSYAWPVDQSVRARSVAF